MITNRDDNEKGFAGIERSTSEDVHGDLRYQEAESLSFSGDGMLPGLTKAFRATRIQQNPIALR